jgi:hypothetical protein
VQKHDGRAPGPSPVYSNSRLSEARVLTTTAARRMPAPPSSLPDVRARRGHATSLTDVSRLSTVGSVRPISGVCHPPNAHHARKVVIHQRRYASSQLRQRSQTSAEGGQGGSRCFLTRNREGISFNSLNRDWQPPVLQISAEVPTFEMPQCRMLPPTILRQFGQKNLSIKQCTPKTRY